jgi:ribosome-binding ATPase
MSLSCGLIGVPSCGKTAIFNAITAAGAAGYSSTGMNEAVVNVPDKRLDRLVAMYHPRKLVTATLDVVDIPGIKANRQEGDSRSSRLLGNIKNVEALVHVVRCFEDAGVPFEYDTINPVRDVETVDLELLAVDTLTLQNKITRLEKKVKAGDKDAVREAEDCQKVNNSIQQGIPVRKQNLTSREKASVWECNLVSLKPILYVANIKTMADVANKHVAALKKVAEEEGAQVIAICGKDEADISLLDPADRFEFLKALGLEESSIERLLGAASRMLGLVTFFTSGEDEVRAWNCRKGDKAPVAAGKIHSDMEKGFIRMEVIRYDDLMALGSEAAVAKAGKQMIVGKDYEVVEGDIVVVRFNAGKG